MRRILRTLGIVTAVIAALLVSASLVLWLLFDPNDYKDDLAALVQQQTGRRFVVEDDLELTFFPWLGVQTGGVRLGQAEGFGEEDFASAEAVTVRVRLLPLLSSRLEIGTVELTGLELNLARDSEGRGNWEDLLGSATQDEATTDTETAESPGSMLQDLDVAGIDIRDGLIFWRENVTDVRYIVSELSLETGPVAIGEPVDAALDFQLVGVDPQFTAQIGARMTVLVDTEASSVEARELDLEFRLEDGEHNERATGRVLTNIQYSDADSAIRLDGMEFESDLSSPPLGPERLSVAATSEQIDIDLNAQSAQLQGFVTTIGDVVARWQITGVGLLDEPAFSGTVSIADAPLADVLELLGLELETEADVGNFDLTSRFQAEPLAGSLALTGLEGSVLDMTFAGEVTVTDQGTQGRIEAPEFDPSTLFSVLPAESIEAVNLSGIDSLTVSTSFEIDGTNQVFSLREFTASIPGATITGALDRLEGGQRLRGRIATSDVDPEIALTIVPLQLPEGLNPGRLGTMRVETAFDYRANTHELRLEDFSAQVLGLQTQGELTVQDLDGSPRLTGNLTVAQFPPRTLFNRFDQPVPVTSDPAALGSVTISATIDVNEDRGQFEDLRIQLDDTTIRGRFTVEDFGNPRYVFDLAMDRVDVDRYLAPPANATAAASDDPAAGDLRLPTAPLRTLAVEGQVSVANLRMAGLSFADVSTSVFVGDGIGRIESARARLYGGEFEGGLELDARAGGPILSLQGSAVTIELEPLLTDLSDQPMITGTGTLDIELSGTGETLNDALATAAGHVDFSLRDGALRGVNFAHILCDTFNRVKGYPRPAATNRQFTPYELLRGTTQVSDGIARTNDLAGTTASFELRGRGQMDLVSQKINYDIDAKMTDKIPIPRCDTLDRAVGDSIPFAVSGTVTEPLALPDVGEIAKRELREELRNRLLEELFN